MTSLPLRLAEARAPRYTSYPTVPHFHEGIDAAVYRQWLSAIPRDQAVSLYLHVPYCHRLCWYCGCHMAVANNYDRVATYVELLQQEITLLFEALGSRRRVTSIHWGGGTPSILTASDFALLMAELRASFEVDPAAEIAIEIDPRHLSMEKAEALADAGVNRASLGVQDVNRHVQEAINRVQPFAATLKAMEYLRSAGIAAFNVDMMYGLPHQSLGDVKRTAELVAGLNPDRISAFGYAHVPWMKKHQRLIDDASLPDAEQRLSQAETAAAVLEHHGYKPVGLDHFALPDDPLFQEASRGHLRRNFQGYTTDQAAVLLGLGPSAIGKLPQGFVQNEKDLTAYGKALQAGRLAVCRGIATTPEDRLRSDIIERLMCDFCVDLGEVAARHGLPGFDFADPLRRLAPYVDEGLATFISAKQLRVNPEGRQAIRLIAACFDAYLGAGAGDHSWRHSKAV